MRDHRNFAAEIRAVPGSNGRQFWTLPLAYEVVDDYGTIWTRGVFDKSVTEKMPALMWGHAGWTDIDQMMGGAIDYRDSDRGPEALYELLDFEAQPKARILAALIEPHERTGQPFVRDMSVGFDRREWEGNGGQRDLKSEDREMRDRRGRPALERMIEAGWDETSSVVAGAVPGAGALTPVRMAQTRSGLAVPLDDVVEIAKRKAAGDLTDAEAQAALDLLGHPGAEAALEAIEDTTDDDLDAVLAEADAALNDLEEV